MRTLVLESFLSVKIITLLNINIILNNTAMLALFSNYIILMKMIHLSIGMVWIPFIVWRVMILERQPYVIIQRLSWIQVVIVLSIMVWNVVECISIGRQLQGITLREC